MLNKCPDCIEGIMVLVSYDEKESTKGQYWCCDKCSASYGYFSEFKQVTEGELQGAQSVC